MKKTPLILSIAAIVISAALLVLYFVGPSNGKKRTKEQSSQSEGSSAVAGDIVFIRIDSLILQYDMYNDLMSAFQSKAQGIQDNLQKKGRKLESDGKVFENNVNKGLITRASAEQQQQSLLKRQNDLQNEVNQKQAELQEEEYVLNNRVLNEIKLFLDEYNDTHNFSLILTTSGATNTIIVGDQSLDITSDVVAGLNDAYVKKRNTKKQDDTLE